MLRDDEVLTVNEPADNVDEFKGVTTTRDAIQEGVIDVISMRALVRAVSNLSKPKNEGSNDHERAIIKMINLNGAMARIVEDGKR